jgi:chaperonin GroEL
MMACLDKPSILIYDGKITTAKQLLPVLENVSQKGQSLLIIAEDIEGEALATLIVNKMRGIVKVAAVKAPEFGDRRTMYLEDIATITGAIVMSKDKGYNLEKMNALQFIEVLGSANSVNVEKDSTTIIDGKGEEDKILIRAEEIKSQLDRASSQFEIEKLQERLAKLTSGVAIVYVGGSNEIEIKEYKDRVEDALFATKAAIEEGIVAGGGAALLHARKYITFNKKDSDNINIGKKIVYEACSKPFTKILTNAGYTEQQCYALVSELNKNNNTSRGYNLRKGKTVHMIDEGIIDPTKVTRLAIENAAAVAGTILVTEAVVYQKPSEKKADEGMDMSQFGM